MTRLKLVRFVVIGTVLLCMLVLGTPSRAQDPISPGANAVAATAPAATPKLLTTQDFESGACQLNRVSRAQLEPFLRDLIARKNYDASCHGGQGGPNASYLSMWIGSVTGELVRRGYCVDDAGNVSWPDSGVTLP